MVDPYKAKDSVLDPEIHGRLVEDLEGVAERAGISPKYIWNPLKLREQEMEWARTYRRHHLERVHGMIYLGHFQDVPARMSALAGALVRNFIDARMMPVQRILDDPPECSVLLIPNFQVGPDLPEWQAARLADVILGRQRTDSRGYSTVLYSAGIKVVRSRFGDLVADKILHGYMKVAA